MSSASTPPHGAAPPASAEPLAQPPATLPATLPPAAVPPAPARAAPVRAAPARVGEANRADADDKATQPRQLVRARARFAKQTCWAGRKPNFTCLRDAVLCAQRGAGAFLNTSSNFRGRDPNSEQSRSPSSHSPQGFGKYLGPWEVCSSPRLSSVPQCCAGSSSTASASTFIRGT